MGDMLCVCVYMYVCLRRSRHSSRRYALDICDSNDTLAPTGVGSRGPHFVDYAQNSITYCERQIVCNHSESYSCLVELAL
jgi:hypothetical protein